jgi:hypothetical protein
MQKLALLLAIPAVVASGQAAAPTTVEQTASPELVGELVKEVGVTPAQAQSAAGALFGVAKTKLSAEDFGKVAGAVPNMDGLLKAAPAADKSNPLASLGTTMAVAGTLSKLGLKPDQIARFTPALVKVVQSKAGAEIGKLLAGALK